jgi:hypothetical protein
MEDHHYFLVLNHGKKEEPHTEGNRYHRNACHADIAEDCLQDKTSGEETVTKLQTKHDFRDMPEHCHPTLEHFCTPCSQYEFNSFINAKNERLSQNSTGFEFLRRLQVTASK